MGSGNSKVEAAKIPEPEPVNILITNDVKERWERLYIQSREQQLRARIAEKLQEIDKVTASSSSSLPLKEGRKEELAEKEQGHFAAPAESLVSAAATSSVELLAGGSNSKSDAAPTTLNDAVKQTVSLKEEVKVPGESITSTKPGLPELPVFETSRTESDAVTALNEKVKQAIPKQDIKEHGSSTSPDASVIGLPVPESSDQNKSDAAAVQLEGSYIVNPKENQHNSETPEIKSMDKIATLFVSRNPSKRRDLENGDGLDDEMISQTGYSAFSKKSNEYYDPAVYEEVNETVIEDYWKKRNVENLIDEEAIIGNEPDNAFLKSKWSHRAKEVRVPEPILPVIVDQDEKGKIIIETINAWKVRQELEDEMIKNNAYWRDELKRFTSKMEDEAKADDFQQRVDQLRKNHGDVIEPAVPNGQCTVLVSQIGECYQKNSKQVLKCSDLVQKFAQCTNQFV